MYQSDSYLAELAHPLLKYQLAAESYDYVKNNTFKKMADDWSAGARAQINNANGTKLNGLGNPEFDPTNPGIATEDYFKRAQRVAASLLYRFFAETEQLA